MIQIRFKVQGSNSLIGGFSGGDLARVDDALAHHLVEEARVAEYIPPPPPLGPANRVYSDTFGVLTLKKPRKSTEAK